MIICKNALRDSFPISPRDRGTKSKSTVESMKRVTCGTYARVSTRTQQTDLQLTDLRKYVKRMGWTAVEYVEKASSVKHRPVFERLLQDAKAGNIDILL